MTEPLLAFTQNGADFAWSKERSEAFNLIKNNFTCPQALAFPDMTRPFTISSDASGVAVGALLSRSHRKMTRNIQLP